MTLVHLMNLVTEEDLASPLFSSSLDSHFESTLLPLFRQHGRRIANASSGDDRKPEASEKIMAMANAETHLGLLKGGLKSREDGEMEEDEEEEEEYVVDEKKEEKTVESDGADRSDNDDASMPSKKNRSSNNNHSLKLVESLLALFSSTKAEDLDQLYADELSFPSTNTAPNFKQTFD